MNTALEHNVGIARLKPLLVFALGGLLVSLCSFLIWMHVNTGDQISLSGKVSSVSTTSISIINREQQSTEFVVGDTTTISRRHEALRLEDVQVGDFVQVFGVQAETGRYHANTIRCLRPLEKPQS